MSSYLEAIPKYVFAELDSRKEAHRTRGRKLVDLGIGSPDQPIPTPVLEAVAEAAGSAPMSGYPPFRIHPAFGAAAANYMMDRFGVSGEPARDYLALAGSKEGLAQVVMALCNPGDTVLIPEVHYPVYSRAPLLIGARPVYVPFRNDGSGLLDLEAISRSDAEKARILIINYPANPTTAIASTDFLATTVEFCDKHDIVLVSDLAYSELAYDNFTVPSVLQVPGADRVAVEFHSCSKSFNMAGMRSAFVTGRRDILAKVESYRSNIGYGVATVSQLAGAAAFKGHHAFVPPILNEYARRRSALAKGFADGGWEVTLPKATLYFWIDVPEGFDDWGWVETLMEHEGVVVTPGIAFGEAGRGKFRISLVQPADVLEKMGKAIAGMRTAAAR